MTFLSSHCSALCKKNIVYLIKLDTKRLKDLEKLDPNSIIGGRTVSEIVKRFNKKIKDPRDNYKGKKNVKIIRDFLNINT